MNLMIKLLEIKKSIPDLTKDATNVHQKYNYVSSSNVLNAVRDKMNEHKILLLPAVVSTKTQMLKNQILTELTMEMTFMDIESEETYVTKWYAQGADLGEKGVGKALTYAEKYFILKFFNIPTDGDDPDRGQKIPIPGKKAEIVKTFIGKQTESEEVTYASKELLEKVSNILLISECGKAVAKEYLVAQKMITNNDGRTLTEVNAKLIIENQERFLNSVAAWNKEKISE